MKYYCNNIYPIALVLSYDTDSVNKYYSDINGNDVEGKVTVEAYTLQLQRRSEEYYAMAVGIVFNVPITARLSAREGFHASYFMMDRLGIPLTDYSDEAWAYLMGWIAECIDDFKKDENNAI